MPLVASCGAEGTELTRLRMVLAWPSRTLGSSRLSFSCIMAQFCRPVAAATALSTESDMKAPVRTRLPRGEMVAQRRPHPFYGPHCTFFMLAVSAPARGPGTGWAVPNAVQDHS